MDIHKAFKIKNENVVSHQQTFALFILKKKSQSWNFQQFGDFRFEIRTNVAFGDN